MTSASLFFISRFSALIILTSSRRRESVIQLFEFYRPIGQPRKGPFAIRYSDERTYKLAPGAPEVDAKLDARASACSGSNESSSTLCQCDTWHVDGI
jgi:hypothetical protein